MLDFQTDPLLELPIADAGGSEQLEADLVPHASLEILGRAVSLQRLIVLKKAPAASPGLGDGVLGIDAMSGSFRLGFRAMQFTLK